MYDCVYHDFWLYPLMFEHSHCLHKYKYLQNQYWTVRAHVNRRLGAGRTAAAHQLPAIRSVVYLK